MINYTIQPTDNKEKLDFTANQEEILITIPFETEEIFQEDFRAMLCLNQGINLSLSSETGVILKTDSLKITRPQDLFYLIRISINNWKAIRAENYVVENTNREVLLNDKQLESSDPIYQFLYPSGSSKNIILPNPPNTNDHFVINNINREEAFNLNIKETEESPIFISLGKTNSRFLIEAIYDGTTWQITRF